MKPPDFVVFDHVADIRVIGCQILKNRVSGFFDLTGDNLL